jgi:hypothetical protein
LLRLFHTKISFEVCALRVVCSYLSPNPEVQQWLQQLNQAGKSHFLLTNSLLRGRYLDFDRSLSFSLFLVPVLVLVPWYLFLIHCTVSMSALLSFFPLVGSFPFVDAGMRHMFGSDWQLLFDAVIVNAKKPLFFTSNYPFRTYNPVRRTTEWKAVDAISRGQVGC